MTTTLQGIYIRTTSTRTEPSPHTVYEIQVQAAVRAWEVWHRYSDFLDLHRDLGSPPFPLPPKHAFTLWKSVNDKKLIEERRVALEGYLRAILGAKDPQWRNNRAFLDFLEVPSATQAASQPHEIYTSASWLEDQTELQTLVRDIRADVNKRDALASQGDVSASHASNVQAKKKLAALVSRVGSLAKGLETLSKGGMSRGELTRRGDMVARLQDDCIKLGEMVVAARQASRSTLSSNIDPAPTAERIALLGATEAAPITRVFGSKASAPKETDVTRPLGDRDLLQYQQVQMNEQDAQLTQLSAILKRQNQLGVAIGTEIQEQNEMLDALTTDVDRTNANLGKARKQLGKLEAK